MPGGMPVRTGPNPQVYSNPMAASLVRRTPTIEEVMRKARLGLPLTPEEQALLDSGGGATPSGDTAASSISGMDDAAEQQLTPQEMATINQGLVAPEKRADIARRMERAQGLLDAGLPSHSRIGMSSGTSYVPANTWGEVLGQAAQNAVGAYQSRKAQRMSDKLRQKEKVARQTYMERVLSKPRSEMNYGIASTTQRDLANIKPPQYDFGQGTIWDRLRSYF